MRWWFGEGSLNPLQPPSEPRAPKTLTAQTTPSIFTAPAYPARAPWCARGSGRTSCGANPPGRRRKTTRRVGALPQPLAPQSLQLNPPSLPQRHRTKLKKLRSDGELRGAQ